MLGWTHQPLDDASSRLTLVLIWFINLFFSFVFFLLASFVANITSISLQWLAAKKQGPGIGGNAPELDLIFHLSRYEPSEITWNHTDGKCQDSRRQSIICDSSKIKYSCTRLKLSQSNWLIYLSEGVKMEFVLRSQISTTFYSLIYTLRFLARFLGYNKGPSLCHSRLSSSR